jgi:hypothetical protein
MRSKRVSRRVEKIGASGVCGGGGTSATENVGAPTFQVLLELLRRTKIAREIQGMLEVVREFEVKVIL